MEKTMAKPTTKRFGEFLIQVGDGASPETFTARCGLTSKGFNQTANTNDTNVPDCDDPDAPADVERSVVSKSREISGSGVMATEAFSTWQAWYDDSTSKNCRVYPMGLTGGYYEGAFILTGFNLTADLGDKVKVALTMESDGAVSWTAAT
jgi:predicted secreted protein